MCLYSLEGKTLFCEQVQFDINVSNFYIKIDYAGLGESDGRTKKFGNSQFLVNSR